MKNSQAVRTSMRRISAGRSTNRRDVLAAEEPLEIRIRDVPVAVTMRTPGDDFELAAGFLCTEGILRGPQDVGAISYCPNTKAAGLRNVVNVVPARGVRCDLSRLKRNFYATSSCGLCGKAAIEAIRTYAPAIRESGKISRDILYRLPSQLRKAQAVFDKTGGMHAAGLFDWDGRLAMVKEDVGRHNAVDKVIGAMLLDERFPLNRHILMVSGRASFEIMQKALVARIPIVAAVSAPTSLAVQLARESGMTMVGFLRGREMNVYAGQERVAARSV